MPGNLVNGDCFEEVQKTFLNRDLVHSGQDAYYNLRGIVQFIKTGEVIDALPLFYLDHPLMKSPHLTKFDMEGNVSHTCQKGESTRTATVCEGIQHATNCKVEGIIFVEQSSPVVLKDTVKGEKRLQLTRDALYRAIDQFGQFGALVDKVCRPAHQLQGFPQENPGVIRAFVGHIHFPRASMWSDPAIASHVINKPQQGTILANLKQRMLGKIWGDLAYASTSLLLMHHITSTLNGLTDVRFLLRESMALIPNFIPIGRWSHNHEVWVVLYKRPFFNKKTLKKRYS